MKKATGTLALLGGGEWTEPCRGARQPPARSWPAPTRCSSCPTAAAFEHPGPGRRAGDRVVRRRSARRSPASPVLNRRDAEADDERRGDARRAVRLPRRRLAAAPALGAEGQRALRRAARTRYSRRRGDRRVGRGRDRAVRPDGRPARRRVHRRARARAGPRGVPVPRHARPTTCASGRSTSCPPTRCSSASTSTPRSCATATGEWDVVGRGHASPSTARAPSPTVLTRRRARRSTSSSPRR